MSPPDTPAPPISFENDALPPGTRFGEFEIVRVIGSGGFGIVYLARDHSLEREVALKEYMPATLATRGAGPQITVRSAAHAETYAIGLRSFVNEARLLARFDHPSLVKVYRFWEDNQTAYMVMPYLQGVTLRDTRRAMAHPPDEAWIRRVIDPVMSALELLHREGVYHRDIAPDNILLPAEGPPVLLDFGAARRVISDRTQSLTAILKPSYAPIEQYAEMSQMRQGPWTDIYALGAVVHSLLFGQPPKPAVARALDTEGDPFVDRSVEGVSARFVEAIDWALAVRPTQRPQSIAELRGALDGRIAVPLRDHHPITMPGTLAPASTPPAHTDQPTAHSEAAIPTVVPTAPPPPAPERWPPAATTTAAISGDGSAPTIFDPTSAATMSAPRPAFAPPAPSQAPVTSVPTFASGSRAPAPPSGPATAWPSMPSTVAARADSPEFEARRAAAAAMRSTIFPRPPAPAAAAPGWKNALAIAVIAALFILVVGLAAWLVLDDGKPQRSAKGASNAAGEASAPATSTARASQPANDANAPLPAATSAAPAAASMAVASASAPADTASMSSTLGPARASAMSAVTAGPAVADAHGGGPSAPPTTARVAVGSTSAASAASAPVRLRPPSGARPDGALRPLPGSEHPYEGAPSMQGGSTADARPRPSPAPAVAPAAQGPSSAREACGNRGFFAQAVCMDRECDTPRFRDTAECVPVLARKRAREGR